MQSKNNLPTGCDFCAKDLRFSLPLLQQKIRNPKSSSASMKMISLSLKYPGEERSDDRAGLPKGSVTATNATIPATS